MATETNQSMLGRLFTNFKAYHAKHPIIVSYILMCGVVSVFVVRGEYLADKRMQCVSKYKQNFIVIRPDDPAVTMIKRGPIGMDY